MGEEGSASCCRDQVFLAKLVAHDERQVQVALHEFELMSQLWQSPEVKTNRISASCTLAYSCRLHCVKVVLQLVILIPQCLLIGALRWLAAVILRCIHGRISEHSRLVDTRIALT